MDVRNLGERLEHDERLDAIADPLHDLATGALPRGPAKDALHGVWLGHPLHPLLTDLPIGFWTSAWVLDMVGGRKGAPAARRLVALGVLSAAPTVAAGLADWSELNRPERRSGVVHAAANATATALYAWSWLARVRGRRGRGVALGMAGAAAATVGGFLGGHLSYRRAAGVNHASSATEVSRWTELQGPLPTADGEATLAELDGTEVAVVRTGGEVHALADRCSHVGGPLHEGDVVDGCLRCPWHGSTFRLADGTVVRGPATSTQPAYEVQGTTARRRPMP